MEINLFVNDDGRNSNIIDFCMQSKRLKFVFQKLSNIKLIYNQKKLIILKENFLINDFKKKLKKNISFFSVSSCLLLSKKYSQIDLDINTNIIYYPIRFINFENILLKNFKRQKILFKNLELMNNGSLFNNDNKKHAYLTEIESQFILLLFENDIVDKEVLNRDVLNQSPLVDSKSLESHLYRLRNKVIKIDSKKKIILIKNSGLKIK